MRRAERLFRLVALMRENKLIRAEDLATVLEVSTRTIYRDIAHLQASGLPIEGEAGLGYLMRPGFSLPAMTLTHQQIDALAIGLKFVEEAGDDDLVQSAKEVRQKIQSSLPMENDIRLGDAPFFVARKGFRAPPLAKQIREAIHKKLKVKLCYTDTNQLKSERLVRPLSLTVYSEGWMFAAWCELREDFRYFRLDRISEFCLTDQPYPLDEDKSLKQYRATLRESD